MDVVLVVEVQDRLLELLNLRLEDSDGWVLGQLALATGLDQALGSRVGRKCDIVSNGRYNGVIDFLHA